MIGLVGLLGQSSLIWVDPLVDSFYSVNHVNVNYLNKYSTVDCKYLLFLQDFFLSIKTKKVQKMPIV